MSNFLLNAHSGLRYLILLAGVLTVLYAVYGVASTRTYDKTGDDPGQQVWRIERVGSCRPALPEPCICKSFSGSLCCSQAGSNQR